MLNHRQPNTYSGTIRSVVTRPKPSFTYLLLLLVGAVALALSMTGSLTVAVGLGLVALATGLIVVAVRGRSDEGPQSPGRRRFLGWAAVTGLLFVTGGAGLGRLIRRLTKTDPMPAIDAMAGSLGSEYMQLVTRGYHSASSGDLQLLLAPGNTSNYSQESVSLIHNDPRSSHASVWMYLERVPLAIYAPGITPQLPPKIEGITLGQGTNPTRVTLADIAPTIANLIGFDDFHAPDGKSLVAESPKPPKVVVTVVVDGGGWNVLDQWPDAWPNLKHLYGETVLFTNAIHGSFPAVTAVAHATIGTGAFADKHGVSGHNVRRGTQVGKAYGQLGHANPADLLLPTLAERWSDHVGGKAFIGEFGYQIWHLGMIGTGGNMPLGQKPVAVYWDEPNYRWASQNPDLYRLPKVVPPDTKWRQDFEAYKIAHPQDFPPNQPDMAAKQAPACVPATVEYQGDLIQAAFDSEDIGNHEATDLVFINFKFPDYTGHIYNMLYPQEETMLKAVDEQVGRIADMLDARFPGEYALILTADHGQCPLPDQVDGVRLDPIQIQADIEAEFGGRSVYPIVHYVAPSEIWLNPAGLIDSGFSSADIAAWLRDYTYGQNYHLYDGVPHDAVEWSRLDHKLFSAVLPGPYIDDLQDGGGSPFGPGSFPSADPGIPKNV